MKVAPIKGIMRFRKKGKLSPRHVGPFEILDKVGDVAYRLTLPPSLPNVHNLFHISMLRRYILNPSHVLNYEQLELSQDVSYEKHLVKILDTKEKELRNKKIPLVKVLWKNHKVEEATWEREEEMKTKHPHLFG